MGGADRLVLVTDDRRLPDPLAAAARLPPGSLVILRCRDTDRRRILGLALRRLCRLRRLALLIAGDFDLALSLSAGLHLPEAMLRHPCPRLRLWHRRGRPLTAAAHGRNALVAARRLGVDAALLAPVFATASHPGQPVLGPLLFRRLLRTARLPVYALGGITGRTVNRLRGSRAAGVAAVEGFRPPCVKYDAGWDCAGEGL